MFRALPDVLSRRYTELVPGHDTITSRVHGRGDSIRFRIQARSILESSMVLLNSWEPWVVVPDEVELRYEEKIHRTPLTGRQ